MAMEIVISLVGSSDVLSNYDGIITIIQMGILGLLLIEILYSISIKSSLGVDEFICSLFIAYIFLSAIWSENLQIYTHSLNCLYVAVAFIIYIINKRYGNKQFDSVLMKIFRVILWIDFGVVAYQVLRLNINSDFSNGIFGSTHYYNGVQGLFCIVCCCYSLYLRFLEKEDEKIFISDILICCLICAISEIKTFFFMLLLILLLYIVFIKKIERSVFKKIIVVTGIVLIIVVAFSILNVYYGQNTVVFSNKKLMFQYLGYRNNGYGKGSRFGDIQALFDNDLKTILIGKGFSEGMMSSVYGMASLLHSVGVLGGIMLGLFFITNIFAAKNKGKFNFWFAVMCSVQCIMAEIVWAGIFGNIVSFFSIVIFAMITRRES